MNNVFEERLLETSSNSGLVYLDAETMVPLINQVRKATKPWVEVKAVLADVYRKLDIEGIGPTASEHRSPRRSQLLTLESAAHFAFLDASRNTYRVDLDVPHLLQPHHFLR